MVNVSLKLPAQLNKKLAVAAKKGRTTKSAVVRKALDAYLNGKKTAKKGSFLELAGDLVGRFEGPGDLSYNPEYMRDFGK
ncbi:MAG: ribbon-helix-helix protein, CopG family [Planctomycetaceae bacterium]|nr:ribbon-helix-helix protein, CopG family [Planctomycetaceae bacterium]